MKRIVPRGYLAVEPRAIKVEILLALSKLDLAPKGEPEFHITDSDYVMLVLKYPHFLDIMEVLDGPD